MKKLTLAFMAFTTIAMVGCKGGDEPQQEKEQPYIYAFYMPQQVIDCTKFFIDEGDGKGEHVLEASKWGAFNGDSEEGKNLKQTYKDNPSIDWTTVRQYVVYETNPRNIYITKAEVDSVSMPKTSFCSVSGKFYYSPTSVKGGGNAASYTYNTENPSLSLKAVKRFANKAVGNFN